MAKLSYETDQGKMFEILEGSHIFVRGVHGENAFWEWESATAVHKELGKMLAQGEKMLQGLRDFVESHPFITDGY